MKREHILYRMTRVIFQQRLLLLYFITLVSIHLSLPLCNMEITIVIPGTGENKSNMHRVLKIVQNKSFKLSAVNILKFSTASRPVIFFFQTKYIFPRLALKSFHEINPLQCSFLENPRDGEAWWAVIYGVSQSQTRLKRLSSSSSSNSMRLIQSNLLHVFIINRPLLMFVSFFTITCLNYHHSIKIEFRIETAIGSCWLAHNFSKLSPCYPYIWKHG